MSVYQCSYCKEMKDSDRDGCEYDPTNPSKLVDAECAQEITERMEEIEKPMKAAGLKGGDFL